MCVQSIKDLTEGLKKRERKPVVARPVSSEASLVTSEVSSSRRERSPEIEYAEGETVADDVPAPFDAGEDLQWVEPAMPPSPPPHASSLPSQQISQRAGPPPVPPHGRGRDGGRREDTRREIERELVRRERAEEKAKKPKRKAPTVAQAKGAGHVQLRIKHSKELPAGMEDEGKVMGIPSYKKLHPPPSHPAPSPPSEDPVLDLADQKTALKGLPPSSEHLHTTHTIKLSLSLPPPQLSHGG